MSVRVLYFAGLRDAVNCGEEELRELPSGVKTVGDLRNWLSARGDRWVALRPGQSVRAAVNQELAPANRPIAEGDEVAFFPPVTGG